MANKIFFYTYKEVTLDAKAFDVHIQVFELKDGLPLHVGEVTMPKPADDQEPKFSADTEAQKIILQEERLSGRTVAKMTAEGRSKGSPDYYLKKYYNGAAAERYGYQIIDLRKAEPITEPR